MALQELQGKTLGEKHRYFNELVKKSINGEYNIQVKDFDPADNDVINLMKIDIAGNKGNVEYILKILQCEDMLYVSRAIKRSKWLITDSQYSHIINPRYLHTQLFPNMISKACAKLLLHIRLHLKDADRVGDFYNFIKEKDLHAALCWLPCCSLSLIEEEVAKHYENINLQLLKRLCERSITILDIVIKSSESDSYKKMKLDATKFILNSQTDLFLDIVETLPSNAVPNFGPKATRTLIKNCRQRILDKLETYCDRIHTYTFAKHFKPEELKDFLYMISKKKEMQPWLKYDNLKHFVRYLPTEGRFNFINSFFIENTEKEDDEYVKNKDESSSAANIYQWYRFAPFKVAYAEITKLIHTESLPLKRVAMFGVLLSSTNRNMQDVETIIHYYNDHHINDAFEFKVQFVNMLLTKVDTYRLNKTAWNALDNIFYSMEVYVKSENNVQTYIEAIILYKLLHKEKMPKIIKSKFKFQSFAKVQKKLTEKEGRKVFDFLYNTLKDNIKNKNISNEIELTETVNLLENFQILLTNWDKNLVDYPWVITKLKELIQLKILNSWKTNFSTLFSKNNSWRRLMFDESLMLSPSEKTCYNALKYDPELMTRNQSSVDQLRYDDNVSLRRVLRALRVYWPQTLAANWMAWYLSKLDKPGVNKSIICGICLLANQQQLIDIIKMYAPSESKIDCSEDNEVKLNVSKHLAGNMHLSRPLLSPDVVLLYAKGDYLQFAYPSITAVFHNISAKQTSELLPKLLNFPVSLLKYSLLFSYTKLQSEELNSLFYDIWKESRNPMLRWALFKQAHKILCKQKNPILMQKMWKLLSVFIDNLSSKENIIMYEFLPNAVSEVPLMLRGECLMKCYSSLKSVPHDIRSRRCGFCNEHEEECNDPLVCLRAEIYNLIEHLDSEFVASALLESFEGTFSTSAYGHYHSIASYVLHAADAETQSERYEKVVRPALEHCFASWDVNLYYDNNFNYDGYWARLNALNLLKEIYRQYRSFVFDKKMIVATKNFTDIQDQLGKWLPVEKHYKTQTTWKLIATFVKVLEEQILAGTTVTVNNATEIYLKAVPQFAQMSLEYLREDIKNRCPSIYLVFAECLKHVFKGIDELVYLEYLQALLMDEEFIPSYLVVLNNIAHGFKAESEKKLSIIRKMIVSNPSVEVKLHYNKIYSP